MELQTDKLKLADIDPDKAKKFAQRLHRKKEEIEITRKSAVADVSDASDDERTITARVSTPDRDRDGEVVEPKGIDLTHFNTNPVLMWAHEYKKPPIGRAMWSRIDDKGLLCKFEFAKTAFADEIYTLYRDGFLKTFSIGFIPIEFDGKTKTHKRASLLEVSACPIPSDPFALIEASAKGLKLCDSLKHDLGLDAPLPAPEQEPNADTNAADDTAIAVEDTASKIMDAEGNPSTYDIMNAIETALKPSDMLEAPLPRRWVGDVFPVDFPNGHFIFGQLESDGIYRQYRQSYTYADGKAEIIGEPVEVVVTYAEKEAAAPETKDAPDVGNVTVTLKPDEVAAALLALSAKVDALVESLTPPPVPAQADAPEAGDIIELESEPEIDLADIQPAQVHAPVTPPKSATPASITEADVLAAIDRLDLQSIIKQNVDIALDKLRGRVR